MFLRPFGLYCNACFGSVFVSIRLFFYFAKYVDFHSTLKQSRYRSGVVQRFPEFMTTAQDGGKVVSLKHRPLLPPGSAPGTHFC